MARRLTHEESRAIKRTMRATPRISQRMHDGWFGDDGRFVIKAGKPPIGQLLEATKSDVGKWSVEVVDIWEADASDTCRQSSAGRKTNQKTVRACRRNATPKWPRRAWLAVIIGGALSCAARKDAVNFRNLALVAISVFAFFAVGVTVYWKRARSASPGHVK
jgi:hypothetical protein